MDKDSPTIPNKNNPCLKTSKYSLIFNSKLVFIWRGLCHFVGSPHNRAGTCCVMVTTLQAGKDVGLGDYGPLCPEMEAHGVQELAYMGTLAQRDKACHHVLTEVVQSQGLAVDSVIMPNISQNDLEKFNYARVLFFSSR